MVLTIDIKQKLLEKIAQSPHSIQELAFELEKNWRTMSNYINKLEEEGLIKTKEFKKGDRVVFRIAYIPSDKEPLSGVQERILRQIESGRRSQDFSSLNIVQYVAKSKTTACFKPKEQNKDQSTKALASFLRSATNQLLLFSGDISWIELKIGNKSMLSLLESLAKDGVSIRLLTRIDLTTKKSVEELLNINHKLGRNLIEIHHDEQPLRCFIADGKIARLKEPVFSNLNDQLKKTGTIFYEISDEQWVNWMERIFWKMFRVSVPAEKRLELLDEINIFKKI